MNAKSFNSALAEEVAYFYADPLGFVTTFLGGEPDANQAEFLLELGREVKARRFNPAAPAPVMPILMSESSGHGTGKSVLGAWLTWWIASTRPGSRGTVTAGTYTQLESRTWSAIMEWGKRCPTAAWFDMQSHGIYSKLNPEGWYVLAQSCAEENAQTFAGQHAADSTSWYLFDEASAVPEGVFDVAQGGLTDGEPMMFAWGQMERNTGRFYEICFGSLAHRWNTRAVDSRSSRFTNKALIDQWISDYGEDSDWCRVRIFGQPPRASELQFIDHGRIADASQRNVEVLHDEPLVCGFDVSGGGAAWNVWRFRRGLDARSIAPVRLTGEQGRDRAVLIAVCAEILRGNFSGRAVAMMFIDAAFGAAVCERLQTLGFGDRVMEINFGSPVRDKLVANQRAMMWSSMKDWLQRGAIDNDPKLKRGLGGPGYHLQRVHNALTIESKADMQKRGEASPDDADALALTFAYPVAPQVRDEIPIVHSTGDTRLSEYGWMR